MELLWWYGNDTEKPSVPARRRLEWSEFVYLNDGKCLEEPRRTLQDSRRTETRGPRVNESVATGPAPPHSNDFRRAQAVDYSWHGRARDDFGMWNA